MVQNMVVIEIGAGSDIPTVRYQSENVGGTLIRINPREPESDYEHTISIPLGGLDALQKIHASPDLKNLTITPYEPIAQNIRNINSKHKPLGVFDEQLKKWSIQRVK